MKLSAAFEASIALSFGDVSDAYQFFPSTLGISDNPDYRANLQHCRITDIDYKRNHAGVSDHVPRCVPLGLAPDRGTNWLGPPTARPRPAGAGFFHPQPAGSDAGAAGADPRHRRGDPPAGRQLGLEAGRPGRVAGWGKTRPQTGPPAPAGPPAFPGEEAARRP